MRLVLIGFVNDAAGGNLMQVDHLDLSSRSSATARIHSAAFSAKRPERTEPITIPVFNLVIVGSFQGSVELQMPGWAVKVGGLGSGHVALGRGRIATRNHEAYFEHYPTIHRMPALLRLRMPLNSSPQGRRDMAFLW